MDLYDFLKKIAETAESRDCLLMEWKNDFLEVMPQIEKECGHWQGLIDDDGKIMLGRLFLKLMDWKYYNKNSINESVPVPFHCYAITQDDVLFTKQELEWDEGKKQYSGIYAEAMRDVSLRLTHPERYNSNETKQSEYAKSSGCLSIIIIIIATVIALV